MQEAGKKAATGIKVISLKTNACIYEKDADTVLIPASNTKLLTAGAAYQLLGADFCFQTELFTDRQPNSIESIISISKDQVIRRLPHKISNHLYIS